MRYNKVTAVIDIVLAVLALVGTPLKYMGIVNIPTVFLTIGWVSVIMDTVVLLVLFIRTIKNRH